MHISMQAKCGDDREERGEPKRPALKSQVPDCLPNLGAQPAPPRRLWNEDRFLPEVPRKSSLRAVTLKEAVAQQEVYPSTRAVQMNSRLQGSRSIFWEVANHGRRQVLS